ncbi:MAG: DUF1697 domain-containing protein [Actinobacteria bacterium]|nr:DUF1697 domain-containing protein [Actinomycetota bacterium]
MDERRWVAFLRGMNLGGRRVTNDELVGAVRSFGCDDVEAYQASGNVVFNDHRDADELADALENGLAAELGYPVPVFLRDADEVRAVAAASPFTADQLASSDGRRQVVFLHDEPSADALHEVAALLPDGDVLVPAGRELHWLPAGGLSDNGMDLHRLDQLTGGTTIRTHGTVQRIARKYL